ncbi:MAG: hypothetical protein PVJ01_04620 [Pseudomonadota bacterium]
MEPTTNVHNGARRRWRVDIFSALETLGWVGIQAPVELGTNTPARHPGTSRGAGRIGRSDNLTW